MIPSVPFLQITESHQSWKADTSGTAKALAADFARLTGEDYKVESIEKVMELSSCEVEWILKMKTGNKKPPEE